MALKKPSDRPNVSREELLKYYREMLLIRRFEEKAGQMYGMGLIGGFCHLYIGQEAVIVGLMGAARKGDQIGPGIGREAVEIGLTVGTGQLQHLHAVLPVGNIGEQGRVGGGHHHILCIVQRTARREALVKLGCQRFLDVDDHQAFALAERLSEQLSFRADNGGEAATPQAFLQNTVLRNTLNLLFR
mgnify:CR=1 FL=1